MHMHALSPIFTNYRCMHAYNLYRCESSLSGAMPLDASICCGVGLLKSGPVWVPVRECTCTCVVHKEGRGAARCIKARFCKREWIMDHTRNSFWLSTQCCRTLSSFVLLAHTRPHRRRERARERKRTREGESARKRELHIHSHTHTHTHTHTCTCTHMHTHAHTHAHTITAA